MEDQKKYILFYDDECSFCYRFKQALEHYDEENSLLFYSIRDEQTYEEFPFLDPEKCHDQVHLINPEGDIFVGPDVIAEIVKIIPKVSKLTWLLDNQASKKALDLFYGAVNNLRKSKVNPCRKCRDCK